MSKTTPKPTPQDSTMVPVSATVINLLQAEADRLTSKANRNADSAVALQKQADAVTQAITDLGGNSQTKMFD